MKRQLLFLIVALGLLLTQTGAAQKPEPQPPPPTAPPPPSFPPEGFCPKNPCGPWPKSLEGHWVVAESGQPEMAPASIIPQATSGPDDFGYTWDDSVALNWIDATSGTDAGLSGWGDYTGPIPIGFPFKYYENVYTELYITGSGYISFDDEDLWDSQGRIPNPSAPNNVIAPYWTPLELADTGPANRVYYLRGGVAPNRYFVVEWYKVVSPCCQNGDDEIFTFEVVLHENGDILFQYLDMHYDDGYYCGSAGIEDSEGLDGLSYVDFCEQALSSKAVRFYRPAPSARVSIRPLYQGRFTHAGETVAFQVPIRNTGELGSDTYDIFVSSSWPVGLYAADGTTLLMDTDSDGTVDTGPVGQGETVAVTVKVTTPGTASVGDDNSAAITVRSSLNTGKSKTPILQTAVPAPFAQVYRDNADGAMSLYLVQPSAQALKKVTDDNYWGYDMAVAEMPNSFAYFWTRGRWLDSVYVREIEYTLLDRYGETMREVSKLTDHSGVTVETDDYAPAVAVAPNGRIGVLWYRYLWRQVDSTWEANSNIYFAVLDPNGDVIVPPMNLTNNPHWGTT